MGTIATKKFFPPLFSFLIACVHCQLLLPHAFMSIPQNTWHFILYCKSVMLTDVYFDALTVQR